ncbi:unnamed protein product [Pseudo-nitzschia multistriata]|uniref:Uncharacterized protein n=1 Tax=Pseudo-nitzschia multistriata TaxID=183589 RepID=A0A448ZF96_9STRA|nr:unnamed protein product [Pseudo-nitzschia multistriata]
MIAARKLGGFIIPPRTMPQTFLSAFNGLISLMSETTRSQFIDSLEQGIIQEEVLSQASAGPMVMLSLFHELQNPLFAKNNFDANQFLEGVSPALENFHNVSAALENELHAVSRKSQEKKTDGEEENAKEKGETSENISTEVGAVTKEEKDYLLSALQITTESDDSQSKQQRKNAEAILDYEWMNEARDRPDSLAGQLSRMVTKELFQINQLSSKTAFLLQNQSRNVLFREGSCQVDNVALLSARACLFKEKEIPGSSDEDNDNKPKEYEIIDYNFGDEYVEAGTAVGAQVEVLYDVTQEFAIGKSGDKRKDDISSESKASDQSENEDYTSTTIVSVATLEGWLRGGPEGGELRWKLASYRPPYEFPGIDHAY